jgi:hypothetical protein
MKLNRWLIAIVLGMAVSGCTTNYHGPAVHGTMYRLPESYWDYSASRDSINVHDSSTNWQWPSDRPLELPN